MRKRLNLRRKETEVKGETKGPAITFFYKEPSNGFKRRRLSRGDPARDNFFGEFDPGSGRTLAACLTHASRTEILLKLAIKYLSGGRVSNAWVICP